MERNILVSLGDHFEQFVNSNIANGHFRNASEVVQAGLKLLEAEMKSKQLETAIHEGVLSGVAKNFNSKRYLAALKKSGKGD